MLAAFARSLNADDPLAGLEVGAQPDPVVPPGWVRVHVRAAALNHHDLWALRGVGLRPDQLPMILGSDAAGLDEDGREVIVHGLIGDPDWGGDETLDPRRTLLSELYPGALAEWVAVPRRNLVAKPAGLSFEEAACLPTAWLTAYRMLFVRGDLRPGQSVLVQGVGGGVATALITLARAAGLTVYATSRDADRRDRALTLGAHAALEPGARLPERVDAAMETVGQATWAHSVKALKPGGRLVIAGATSGTDLAASELTRIFFTQLIVVGSTMGTRDELSALVSFLGTTGVRPVIDRVLPMADARAGFAALAAGDVFGKVVLTVD